MIIRKLRSKYEPKPTATETNEEEEEPSSSSSAKGSAKGKVPNVKFAEAVNDEGRKLYSLAYSAKEIEQQVSWIKYGNKSTETNRYKPELKTQYNSVM